MSKHTEMMKGLMCLRLEAPASVVTDVERRVLARVGELQEALREAISFAREADIPEELVAHLVKVMEE